MSTIKGELIQDSDSKVTVHSPESLQVKLDRINSIDTQIDRLLSDIKKGESLDINILQKSKVVLVLTKVKVALYCIKRIQKLFEVEVNIEEKIFDEDLIKDLSLKELVGLQSIAGNRLDNYLQKLNDAIYNIDLSELESSLLMITELDNRQSISKDSSVTDGSIKELSLKLLQEIQTVNAEVVG